MPHVEFSWVAKKPFDAEHPVGSGEVVHYEPGDLVPANDWGRAADHMALNDKIAQIAVNVLDPGDVADVAAPPGEGVPTPGLSDPDRAYLAYEGQSVAADAAEEEDDADEPVAGEESAEFPKHLGGGLYELSDGSQVKGKRKAVAAESALSEG